MKKIGNAKLAAERIDVTMPAKLSAAAAAIRWG